MIVGKGLTHEKNLTFRLVGVDDREVFGSDPNERSRSCAR